MKASVVDHSAFAVFLTCAEENRGAKDPLETVDDAPIMSAIFRQAEKVEDFCGRLKSHRAALLANCERGNPNRDRAILAVRQSEVWVSKDVEEESAISPAMDLASGGWTPERQSA